MKLERAFWMILCALLVGALVFVAVRSPNEKRQVEYVKAWKVGDITSPTTDGMYFLQEGDLIISVNGKQCRTLEALRSSLPGVVKVLRGEKEFFYEIGTELGVAVQPVAIFMPREYAPSQ